MWREPLTSFVGDASPSLAAILERLCAGEVLAEKKLRRATTSLVGYVLRAAGRSMPFGLFAGTVHGDFSPHGRVHWGENHRLVVRADETCLQHAVDELEAVPEVVERLRVVADNQCQWRGNSIVLAAGEHRRELTSTGPVEVVLAAAVTPRAVTDVVTRVREEFPQASAARVVELICGLLAHGYLRSSLRPPGTVPDARGHVAAELSRCAVEDLLSATDVATRLPAATVETISDSDSGVSSCAGGGVRRELHLDCGITLPERLGAEVEAGASTLLRLSPHPKGHPVWRQYYEEFVHRYGAGVLVPLLDVVDAEMGLGYPATYPGSLMPTQPQEPQKRETRLLRLAHEAAATGAAEVVLDRTEIERLTVAEPARLPPHVEVGARVAASSMQAIEAGDFTMRLRPARAIGTFTGRFTSADSTMAAVYRNLPTVTEGAVCAQLVFPPSRPSAGNVARTPRFLDHVICLGEYPPNDAEMLALQDLAVMADRNQLYLVHVPSGRVVEPQVLHALSLDHQAPPLARFLAHLPRGCLASFTRFDWGAAAELTSLPRLRYGHTVLAPARWRLHSEDLPAQRVEHKEWRMGLERWREKWRVPVIVKLAQGDQVLPLYLDEPAHTALLRRRLHAAGHVVLTETDYPGGLDWIGGHAHELAVPLLATPSRAPSPLERPVVRTRDRDRGHLPAGPGARWLYAKIYAHPQRQNTILKQHLPTLLAELGEPAWWFVRYRGPNDPDHLRLRFRAHNSAHAAALTVTVGAWAERLRDHGLSPRLCIDTYYPETGRYGAGAQLEAAEAVFATDSAALLDHLNAPEQERYAQVAATMVHIAAVLTDGHEAGLRWHIDHPGERPVTPPPRELHDHTSALIDPGRSVLSNELYEALTRYRNLLTAAPGPPLDGVLSSLLHMHHNRALSAERDSERTCRHLARQAALSWITRNKATP